MTRDEAGKVLSALRAAYPRQQVGADTVLAYATMLEDLDAREVMEAVKRLMATSRFFPTIAEIRQEVVTGRDDVVTGEQAWGEVVRKIGSVGSYQTPEFSDPRTGAAVQCLGWKNICRDENMTATRARFLDAFRSLDSKRARALQLGAHGTEADKQISGQMPELVAKLFPSKR